MPQSVNTDVEYSKISHDETALSDIEFAPIRDWLQPTDYLAESGEYRRHLSSQAPGTGLWICETEEYRKWYSSPDHGSLWIKGVPGAGKSVTAASIIRHLKATEDARCPVLFFFFRDIVAANFSPRAMIQDWMAQLLPFSPKLQHALQARLDTKLEETSDHDLVQLFLDGVSAVSKVFCVADALDEMTADNRAFLEHLNSLATFRPSRLKLLMTSRPKQYLQSALRDSSIVHISLQQRLVDQDIASYLSHRCNQITQLDGEAQSKQRVIDMVAKRSEGLFLYAKLTMDQVEASITKNEALDLHHLEETLPVGLEQTYISMLAAQRRDHDISIELQVMVLEAVTHASRPLRLNELASLVERVGPAVTAPSGFKQLVAVSCGPLVEILEDETLQVIHHSFTEFLRGDTRNSNTESGFPVIVSLHAHKHLTLYCLRYLKSGSMLLEGESDVATESSLTFNTPAHEVDLDEQLYRHSHLGIKDQKDPFKYREARLAHPFLSYAVDHWSYHASRYDLPDEDVFDSVTAFLDPKSLTCLRWLVLKWHSTSKRQKSAEGFPTALHIAAFAGLSELASKLLQQGFCHSATDARERTALHWAAHSGHAKVARLLLQQQDCDSNPADGQGLKPIHLAAKKNHAEVVEVLLEAGVEPDTIKTKEIHAGRLLGGEAITTGESAILYACSAGHTEVIEVMIPFCKPEILEELLCQCCRYGRTDALQAILAESDVSPDATFQKATALYLACKFANQGCALALIQRGANVTKTSAWSPRRSRNGGPWGPECERAPIHTLVAGWEDENDHTCQVIFRELLEAGADVNQLDGDGNAAIHIAAGCLGHYGPRSLHASALKALLDAGADPMMKRSRGGDTPLHILFEKHRTLDAVKLLVERGCDPNTRDEDGATPLHRALSRGGMETGHEENAAIVQYLLDNGADPNLEDGHGDTAVYGAIDAGSYIFQMLLPRCNSHAVKLDCWMRLASIFDEDTFDKLVSILLAEGIDINARGRRTGRTLYFSCLRTGREHQLRTLRSHGALTNTVDNFGNNALHIVLISSLGRADQKKVAKLIDEGVDPLSTNNAGDTLLHIASRNYKGTAKEVELIKWLIGLGVPVNMANNDGQTALHQSLPGMGSLSTTMFDREDRIDFVDALCQASSDIDFTIRDKYGLAAIHVAALTSQNIVARLMTAGADLGVETDDQQNVLHLAARARKTNIVAQIVHQAMVDINKKDKYGRTPLHYAASSGEPETVACLLENGAKVDIIDELDCTMLHACAESRLEQTIWDAQSSTYSSVRGPPKDHLRTRSHNKLLDKEPWYRPRYSSPSPRIIKGVFPGISTIAKLLVQAGVDVAAVDYDGNTALDVALHAGCNELVDFFASDPELFAKAAESVRHDADEKTKSKDEQSIVLMKAQMALMRPQSKLAALEADEATRNAMRTNVHLYFDLLSADDASKIINDSFALNPDAPSHYVTVKKLMESGYTEVAEKVPDLLLQYASYDGAKKSIERQQSDRRYGDKDVLTTLQMACAREVSNMRMVRLLVEEIGVDVNPQGDIGVDIGSQPVPNIADCGEENDEPVPGGTALHLLASGDNYWQLHALEYLLEKGADVNAVDDKGRSPIHIAAKGVPPHFASMKGLWRLDTMKILLKHGANPNILDKRNEAPIHKAAKQPSRMKELLRNGADPLIGSESPIFKVLFEQNLAALNILLDHGLSVNSVNETMHSRDVHYDLTDSRKVYALLHAAYAIKLNSSLKDSIPLLKTLVERGADLYLPLNDGETLIHFLFEFPEYEVLDALLHEPCVSRINFNRRDQHGRTVLMAACDWREVLPGYSHLHWDPKAAGPPIRMLDLGADATLTDDWGKTALHRLLDNEGMPDDVLIEFINRVEVASTLLLKDNDGLTPLHHSLQHLRPEVCNLLISKGADLTEADNRGRTALHHIALQCFKTQRQPRAGGRLSVNLSEDYSTDCRALWQEAISKGCSINAADADSNTPLHLFLQADCEYNCSHPTSETDGNCHIYFYEKLFGVDSGVDVFALNNRGETMLHVIAQIKDCTNEEYDKQLFTFLTKKELDPLKEDARGRSAIDVASACGRDGIVGLFGRK